jgi:hypothetical protein
VNKCLALDITSILALPVVVAIVCRYQDTLHIDYNKSIIVASNNYVAMLEQKAKKLEEITVM